MISVMREETIMNRVQLGDIVVYLTRFNNESHGLVVEKAGTLGKTPIWVIQRLKRGRSSGEIIRENTLQGDILSVVSST